MSRRITVRELAQVRRRAIQRGGVLLSRGPIGHTMKLRFRCQQGHEWTQTAKKLEQGKWCMACARVQKNENVKAAANARLRRVVARRGGEILTPAYVGTLKAMRYRCADGHEWSALAKSVLYGSWCPSCRGSSRSASSERRYRKEFRQVRDIVRRRGGVILSSGLVRSSGNIRVRCEHGHEWKTMPSRLLSESWCPNCKRESFMARIRALAQERGGECLSPECRSWADALEWRCALGHRFRATGNTVRSGSWCATCCSNGRGDIERMREIARARRGLCLSRTYVDATTKLRWRCEEGHVWAAQPGPVVQGSWCPVCSLRGRSRRRLTIAEMRQTAIDRGGACLSRRYQGSNIHLRWRCARGHVWDARPWQVRQGHWCPACAGRVPGTLDGMRALASERSGKCLTRSWTDHRQPVQFECALGHRFGLLSVVAKSGVWCPVCRPTPRSRPASSPARGAS